MTAHQSTGVLVIERFTQDGWDWPNGHHDEKCWPLDLPASEKLELAQRLEQVTRELREVIDLQLGFVQPAPPRVQLLEDSYVQHSDVPVWREEKPRPKCIACRDTGVIRSRPKFGEASEWRTRTVRCPCCDPK